MAEFSWNFCSFGEKEPPKSCKAEELVHLYKITSDLG